MRTVLDLSLVLIEKEDIVTDAEQVEVDDVWQQILNTNRYQFFSTFNYEI